MLSLIHYPDQILDKNLDEFNFDNPIMDPFLLEESMIILMDKENGLGLSANQVGLNARVFVMQTSNLPDVNTPFAVFNPRIIDISQEMELGEEGCLSFPGLFFKVLRPKNIVVEFLDRNNLKRIIELTGIDARCFMHELDHLNGICFIDRISKLKLNLALKKQRKNNGRTQQRTSTSI